MKKVRLPKLDGNGVLVDQISEHWRRLVYETKLVPPFEMVVSKSEFIYLTRIYNSMTPVFAGCPISYEGQEVQVEVTRCKQRFMPEGSYHMKQCSREATCDGYCKQHHPDTIAERRRKKDEAWKEKQAKDPLVLAHLRIKEVLQQHGALLTAVNDVLSHKDGDLPHRGRLFDTDASRAAIGRLAAIAKAQENKA